MQADQKNDDLIGQIPEPDAIRKQLAEHLQKTRILKELLKVSEAAARRRAEVLEDVA